MNKKITLFILIIGGIFMACKGKNNDLEKNIGGYTTEEFKEVKEAFVKNFKKYGEIGASCCVYYKNERVVDLWGGYKDLKRKELWGEDTLSLVFSLTKGISSLCFALAHSRKYFDYNDKITKYWPEFGANGKEDITIAELLSFQSGLVLWDKSTKLTINDMFDNDKISAALEKTTPLWRSGEFHGYSPDLIGHIMNQLFRRIDPYKRTIGEFLSEELSSPLGAEFYIGLPDSVSDERIAKIKLISPIGGLLNIGKVSKPMRKVLLNPNSLFIRSMTGGVENYNPNDRDSLRFEHPGGNGVGTARGIAAIYNEFATGGKKLDIKKKTLELLSSPPKNPTNGVIDKAMNVEAHYSYGFLRSDNELFFSESGKGYGFVGASGSFAFADPELELAYCYIPNKMDYYTVDPRDINLRKAITNCIKKLTQGDKNK